MTSNPSRPSGGTTVIVSTKNEPNLLVRLLWFIFIGWWLSGLTVFVGWFLNVTIVGLPAGIWLLNRVPQAATLKAAPREAVARFNEATGSTHVTMEERPQRPFWQRALYFILVGWWLSGMWLSIAWFLCILIVTMPMGFWMYGAAGKVTTLKR